MLQAKSSKERNKDDEMMSTLSSFQGLLASVAERPIDASLLEGLSSGTSAEAREAYMASLQVANHEIAQLKKKMQAALQKLVASASFWL